MNWKNVIGAGSALATLLALMLSTEFVRSAPVAAEIPVPNAQSLTGGTVSLFTASPSSSLASDLSAKLPRGFSPALRSRPVKLAQTAFSREGVREGLGLKLDLFSDAAYTAHVDRVTASLDGTVTIRGRIEGYPMGTVILTTSGERSLGVIDIPELTKRFSIQNEAGSETYHLVEVDLGRVASLEGAQPVVPPAPLNKIRAAADNPPSDPMDPVTVDVMIVYTPAARIWADANGGGIANVIAQALAKGQLALDNSGTLLTLNLVHSAEVAYVETGTDSVTDLYRLQGNGDGFLDEVHAWRDQYKADLVSVFVVCSDVGGVGFLLNTTEGLPDYGFSLNRVQQAAWTYTVVHEMGHNMGCHHAKAQNVQPGPGMFDYSAGWRWTGSDSGHYCSVMTYEAGSYFSDGITHTRVGYFSSPTVQHLGASTGSAADGDNARTLRETKGVVAAYRIGAPEISVAATDATAGEPGSGQGSGTFTFTRAGSTADALTVNFVVSGTATSGSDFTAIGTTVTIAAGSATATRAVSVLDDASVEGGESVLVTLASGAGYTVGSPASATAMIQDDELPSSGLALWLKADAGVSGTPVSQWSDQSGNNRHATQATGASQPTLVTGALNGLPVVRFDGVNDFLTFNLPVNGLTGMSLFLVAANTLNPGAVTGPQNAALFWNETASWGTVYLSPFQTNVNVRFGTTQVGNNPVFNRPASVGGAFTLTGAIKDGTTDSLYVNGALVLSQGGKLATIAGCQSVGNLGRGYNDNTYFGGDLAEVLVFSRALTTSERQDVEEYLNDKYAIIPLVPPQITSPAKTNAAIGYPYLYPVSASANPRPGYSLSQAPAGMTVDPASGVVSWTPASGDQGLHTVTVVATNRVGTNSQTFAVRVRELPAGLVSYWPLDEVSGTNFSDVLGGYDATCAASARPSAGVGRVNVGQSFNGTNTQMSAAANAAMDFRNTNSFSLEAWIKSDNYAAEVAYFGRIEAAVMTEYSIGQDVLGRPWFYLRDSQNNILSDLIAPTAPAFNQWHHVVGVVDAAAQQARIYVDGVLANTRSTAGRFTGTFSSATAGMDVGWLNLQHGYRFRGALDELALYRRALDAGEIFNHYTNGLAGIGIDGGVAISGSVTYGDTATAVAGADLDLTGSMVLNTPSLIDGSYVLDGIAPGGNYCLQPMKTNDTTPAQGVTTLDITLVRRHILGIAALDSGYKVLAADVNGSRSVSTLDITLMRRVILGITNTFPAGLWRFVPSTYGFTNAQAPWDAPTNCSYTNLQTDLTAENFRAIKLGDVNNTWTVAADGAGPAAAGQDFPAPESGLVLTASRQVAQAGNTVTARVTAAGYKRVSSIQFTLEWDPSVLKYDGVAGELSGLSEANFGTGSTAAGKLAFSWDDPAGSGVTVADGTTLFTVNFTAVGKAGSTSPLALTDSMAPREAGVNFAAAGMRTENGLVSVVEPPRLRMSPADLLAGTFRLSVPMVAGQRYILEFTDTLPGTNWTALPAVIGDGTVMELVDPGAPQRQRFYRVRVEQR